MSGAFAGGLRRAGGWLGRVFLRPPLPLLALEVRPQAVAAVRLAEAHGRLSLAAAACTELPPGVVEVSLTRSNVLETASLQAAMRASLERVGALSAATVSLVLPDPAVRLVLIPGEGVRGRARDAEETVRFRLHKALPFDVRSARVTWRAAGDQVLVAVAPEEVLAGYEAAVEALGYRPGLVEPAGLALTDALASSSTAGDRLLVNWDTGYVSFVLLRQQVPVLVRTLPGESSPDAVARQAAGTLRFHQERLAGVALEEVVVRSAALPGEEAVALLGRALGTAPRLLEPWAALGIEEQGEAAQAVAGAAASALRRAA
ncbi:MAG TPA: hypothetical protein VEQ10_20645 [Vicinamibacteria bacterium]|nr:hypothetical protein [Vicinamibacteria bacterium]